MILLFSPLQYLFYAILYYNFLLINGINGLGNTTTASPTAATVAFNVIESSTGKPVIISTSDISTVLKAANETILINKAAAENLTEIIKELNTTHVKTKTEIEAIVKGIDSLQNAAEVAVNASHSCSAITSSLRNETDHTEIVNNATTKVSVLLQDHINDVSPIKTNAKEDFRAFELAFNQSANTTGITEAVFHRTITAAASVRLMEFVTGALKKKLSAAHLNQSTIKNSTVTLETTTKTANEKKHIGQQKLDHLNGVLNGTASTTAIKKRSKAKLQEEIHNAIAIETSLANATIDLEIAMVLLKNANVSAAAAASSFTTEMQNSLVVNNTVLRIKSLLNSINNESDIEDTLSSNIIQNLTGLKNRLAVWETKTSSKESLEGIVNILTILTTKSNETNENKTELIAQLQSLKYLSMIELEGVTNDSVQTVNKAENRSTIATGILNAAVNKLKELVNNANTTINHARKEVTTLKGIIIRANGTTNINETVLQTALNNTKEKANTAKLQLALALSELKEEIQKSDNVIKSANSTALTLRSKIEDIESLFWEGQEMDNSLVAKTYKIAAKISKANQPSINGPELNKATIATPIEIDSDEDEEILATAIISPGSSTVANIATSKNGSTGIVVKTTSTTNPRGLSTSSILIGSIIGGVVLLAIIASIVIYILMQKGYIKIPNRSGNELKDNQGLETESSLLSDASPSRR